MPKIITDTVKTITTPKKLMTLKGGLVLAGVISFFGYGYIFLTGNNIDLLPLPLKDRVEDFGDNIFGREVE